MSASPRQPAPSNQTTVFISLGLEAGAATASEYTVDEAVTFAERNNECMEMMNHRPFFNAFLDIDCHKSTSGASFTLAERNRIDTAIKGALDETLPQLPYGYYIIGTSSGRGV